jgi:branched-subunit amino acid transport protein AzlD
MILTCPGLNYLILSIIIVLIIFIFVQRAQPFLIFELFHVPSLFGHP